MTICRPMDNDDFSPRQTPTNHKVFWRRHCHLGRRSLPGFWPLSTFASQTQGGTAPQLVLQVIARIGHAVAATGLVGGQVVDLESEGKAISLETLEYIHSHKTGALLEGLGGFGRDPGGGEMRSCWTA
jgi:geranylgeranyl diphosphate synthase type II